MIVKYDKDYPKLTGQHESVITGLSRAKRGISPNVIREKMGLTHTPQNLAISNISTPYGKYYYSFLQKKIINSTRQDNVHLIVVSPASIMDIAYDSIKTRESSQLIYQLRSVSSKPNFEYILKRPTGEKLRREAQSYFSDKPRKFYKVHDTGWVETTVDLNYQKVQRKLGGQYRESSDRMEYLKKTIDLLNKTGNVFLVRMPVTQGVLKIEQEIFPDFDPLILKIASEERIPYLNYSYRGDQYEFYDLPGQHLEGKSAKEFTRKLASDMQAVMLNR